MPTRPRGRRMKIVQPTPELPVPNLAEAQAYYRDRLGFRIEWTNEAGRIGAVSHGSCALFFRETEDVVRPAKFWVFTDDVDAAAAELSARGAEIVEPVRDAAWGMRQFTVRDLCGNLFSFHHDL